MQNLWELTQSINQLCDENHIIVGGSLLTGICGIYRVTTDGLRLWTVANVGIKTAASDITNGWLYDITDRKTIYGCLPSNCSSKSSPAHEMP